MNCKNCEEEILENQNFCAHCGAQVITERLTVKRIWNNLIDQFFGWDNKYLVTIKNLLFRPETVITSYLKGTRKKYVAPFAFLAIGTAITMLLFNQFSEEYMEMVEVIGQTEYDVMETQFDTPAQAEAFEAQRASQAEMNNNIQSGILKYYNILTFLLIPFYAFIAMLVFGKPFNYSEHLVTVTFVHGTIFVFSIFIFLLSVFVSPTIFSVSIFGSIFYYLYVYKRLYGLTFGRTVIKFLKFIGILIGVLFITGIIVVGFGIAYAALK